MFSFQINGKKVDTYYFQIKKNYFKIPNVVEFSVQNLGLFKVGDILEIYRDSNLFFKGKILKCFATFDNKVVFVAVDNSNQIKINTLGALLFYEKVVISDILDKVNIDYEINSEVNNQEISFLPNPKQSIYSFLLDLLNFANKGSYIISSNGVMLKISKPNKTKITFKANNTNIYNQSFLADYIDNVKQITAINNWEFVDNSNTSSINDESFLTGHLFVDNKFISSGGNNFCDFQLSKQKCFDKIYSFEVKDIDNDIDINYTISVNDEILHIFGDFFIFEVVFTQKNNNISTKISCCRFNATDYDEDNNVSNLGDFYVN